MDVVEGHPRVEGEGGEDRALGGGVQAVDVGGRIGLRVPELLGLGEGFAEVHALGGHLVEDVIGGAVDDAEDGHDAVAGQGFAQPVDDRDRAGDGGLVVQVDAGGGRSLVQFRPVGGEERLVAGDHGGARSERFEDEASRGFDAADQLDDDVGLRDDAVRVVGQETAVDRRVPRRLQVPYGYCDDLEPGARSRGQVLRLLFEQASHLSAHGPAPEQADPHVFHAFSFRWE